MAEEGKYIVIEGNDGVGKSTQVALLRERLSADGIDSIEFHEPEGTPIANRLRDIIKDGALERDPETNLLLFTAARHEIWAHARKHLGRGTWIVAARNYYSTLAYQGYGEGLDQSLITDITGRFTDPLYVRPDYACILTLSDEKERLLRIQARGRHETPDTFESMGSPMQQRINRGYQQIAKDMHIPLIASDPLPEVVAEEIYGHLRQKGLFATI